MLIAPSYDSVLDSLGRAFLRRYPNAGIEHVRLVGILFARPVSPVAREEIVPALDDFSYRSANNVDFFLPGYCLGPTPGDASLGFSCQRVEGSRGGFWVFSPELFDSFRRTLEELTTWKYSGGTDLVLANARFTPASQTAFIDFSTSVVCQLDTMKRDKAIESVEMFFERVFRFAEDFDGADPAWSFSDAQVRTTAESALKRLVLSLLPKKLGDDATKAIHFVAKDRRAVR